MSTTGIVRITVLSGLLVVLLGACGAQESQHRTLDALSIADNSEDQLAAKYNGVWAGKITGFHGPGLYEDLLWDHEVRLTIDESSVLVEMLWEGEWQTRTLGTLFHIARHRSHAVVTAMHSDTDEDGEWVETWNFTLAMKDDNTLLSYWYRVVSNLGYDIESPKARFAFAASGSLARVDGTAVSSTSSPPD